MASSAGPAAAEGGEVVFFGASDWSAIGRVDAKKKGGGGGGKAGVASLPAPHRLKGLAGVSISFVASGCISCHCIAIDTSGTCFTWGRNETGQLGHGDLSDRNWPTPVTGLKGAKVTWAAGGRGHTVVVTDDGRSFSWGQNKHGQLGTGSTRSDMETSPKLLPGISKATSVACGADFTAWITAVPDAAEDANGEGPAAGAAAPPNVLTAGLPQYGQLGHGSDNQYNAKEGTVKIVFEPQPTPRKVQALAGKTIVKMACGNNHSVAVDSKGFLYTWGFGGYGRLGHREQKDEFKPRLVEVFQRTNILPPNAVVAAGAAFSACTAGGGQMYMWGKVKATGDNWMYPKPLMDLSGWNVRCMDSGSSSSCVAADNSCITWGTAQYGELGYGPTGPKSSANPKKVDALENFHVLGVACGQGHTMAVLSRSRWAGKPADSQPHIDKLPMFEPSPDAASQGKAGKGKAVAAPAKGKAKAAAPKEVMEEPDEEEEEDEEDEEEEEKPAKKRKAAPKKEAKPKQAKKPATRKR